MIYTYSFDDSTDLICVDTVDLHQADALVAVVTHRTIARRWLPEEFIASDIATDGKHHIIQYVKVEPACPECESPESECSCPINDWWGDDNVE